MNTNNSANYPLIFTLTLGLFALGLAQCAHASVARDPNSVNGSYSDLGRGVSTFLAATESKDGTFNKYVETCKSDLEVLNQCVVEAAIAIGVIDQLYKSNEVDMPTIRACMNQYTFDNGMPDLAQAVKDGCFDFRAGELFFQEMIKIRDSMK